MIVSAELSIGGQKFRADFNSGVSLIIDLPFDGKQLRKFNSIPLKDGLYLLVLQVPAFVSNIAPSKTVVFPLHATG